MTKTKNTTLSVGIVLAVWIASEGAGAELGPKTLAAWERYVEWTEHRIRSDARDGNRFLVQDSLPDAASRSARQKLRAGEVFTMKMEATAYGRAIEVPKGLVHHWLGSIFIPNARVDELVRWLQRYDDHHHYFDEVESSRLVSRNGDDFHIFLRLRRKKIVTVYYNTEHRVRYTRHGRGRVSSASVSTRISELDHAATGEEVEKPIGDDRGFLWRLNSYWRFQQVAGGVIVELESVSLSRGIPFALRWLVGGYLDSVPRESLEATLLPIQREAPRTLTTGEDRHPRAVAVIEN